MFKQYFYNSIELKSSLTAENRLNLNEARFSPSCPKGHVLINSNPLTKLLSWEYNGFKLSGAYFLNIGIGQGLQNIS